MAMMKSFAAIRIDVVNKKSKCRLASRLASRLAGRLAGRQADRHIDKQTYW